MERPVAKLALLADVALTSPYRMIRHGGARARAAVTLNPPTNAFSGLVRSVAGAHRDAYLCAVSAVCVLSEFLPALLSNVPYRVVETYLAQAVSTWLAVAVLSAMVLTVAGSFLVHWPRLPVAPDTLAGAMYYVAVPEASNALVALPASLSDAPRCSSGGDSRAPETPPARSPLP